MTASDHLKQATGSLGGDQIPEDLRNRHEEMYMQATGNFPPEMTGIGPEEAAILIERIAKAEAALAQKTRECEELRDYSKYCEKHESECRRGHLKSASCVRCLLTKATEMRLAAEAKIEQLGRQVAEMGKPAHEIALAAAKEIDGCFDIDMPRGRNYHNGILQTIRIIIETHLTGQSRDSLTSRARTK